jgi:prephenate dehydratase
MKVAIQGMAYSFHDIAARKHFGDHIETVFCSTFRETCEMLDTKQVDYAIMAIENSIAGCLLQNFFLLKDYKLRIAGEVYLHIQMNLMALPGTKIENLKTVQSHPIAIRQCSQYLNTLRDMEVLEKKDTAGCAQEIAENKLENVAAIANEAAANANGLEILEKRIETNKQNFTRFFILSKEPVTIEETNKATLSFQIGHRIGGLADVLNTFCKYDINLSMIQSIPVIGSPNDYLFNIDLTWTDRANYDNSIYELLRKVVNLSILGEYKQAERPII